MGRWNSGTLIVSEVDGITTVHLVKGENKGSLMEIVEANGRWLCMVCAKNTNTVLISNNKRHKRRSGIHEKCLETEKGEEWLFLTSQLESLPKSMDSDSKGTLLSNLYKRWKSERR